MRILLIVLFKQIIKIEYKIKVIRNAVINVYIPNIQFNYLLNFKLVIQVFPNVKVGSLISELEETLRIDVFIIKLYYLFNNFYI